MWGVASEAPSLHKSHWKPAITVRVNFCRALEWSPKQNHQGKLFEERCYCIALRDSCGILIACRTSPSLLISGGPEKQQTRLLAQAASARGDTWASFSKTCGVFFDLSKSSLNDQHEGLWLIHLNQSIPRAKVAFSEKSLSHDHLMNFFYSLLSQFW